MPRIISVFLPQQSCRYNCIFCNQRAAVGRVENLSGADLRNRIEKALENIHTSEDIEIAFYGGSFTFLPDHLQNEYLSIASDYIQNGRAESIRISTRPDGIDEENVSFLRERGVRLIELGAQILDDDILSLIGRGHTVSDVENAVRLIKESKMSVGLQLMIGLPGEDDNIRARAWKRTLALEPDYLRIHPTIVLESTELSDLYRRGLYEPLNIDTAVDIVAEMVIDAEKRGIRVIRIGLQSSTALQEKGVIVAGPWHPSFGQLVQGEIFYRLISSGIKTLAAKTGTLIIYSGEKERNSVTGLGRCNMKRLETRYPSITFQIKADRSMSGYSLKIISELSGGAALTGLDSL
jgi:histone acetyltransferase (RNA polymerase elongator complex component)